MAQVRRPESSVVTALDELRALDERRRVELRAAEEADALARARTEAAARERMEAEEELRRQQRSRAEAQAWAEAQREVEAMRARNAAEDTERIAAIEAEAMARARARLADERAELERQLEAQHARPRPKRGWMLAAMAMAAALVAAGLWGRQQASACDEAIAAQVAARRAAEDAGERVERVNADLRTTLDQVKELRGKIEELRERRQPAAPAVPPTPIVTKPHPTAGKPGKGGPPIYKPITVCADKPIC